MKKIYVVKGSEDGNVGAYSNAKRAYAKAQSYLTQNGPVDLIIGFVDHKPGSSPTMRNMAGSYKNACIKLSDIGFVELEIRGERTTASIEIFYLNQ